MSNLHIHLEPLTAEDISLGMQLKSLAGWNQLEADWRILLAMSQGGSYLAYCAGEKAGTVTTITYGNLRSWIGMVLVDPQFRGLGIGTRLLQAAIEKARESGSVWLDATPQGRKLYGTLGFEDVCRLERMEIAVAPGNLGAAHPLEHHLVMKKLSADSLEECIQYDAKGFGANREKLLAYLYEVAPEYGFAAYRHGKVVGYCLGRHGSRFEQIGPLMAEDFNVARALFEKAVEVCRDKPVIVDIFSGQETWRQYLLDRGFVPQRPFIRMRLGEDNTSTDRSRQFAVAGPEFG